MAQAEFLGAPFYPLTDRNNLLSSKNMSLSYFVSKEQPKRSSAAAKVDVAAAVRHATRRF
jgi:hypothetical protein